MAADKQARAHDLAQQIDILGRRAASLTEQYNEAMLGVQQAEIRVRQADAAVVAAKASADRARHGMEARAVDAYVHSGHLGLTNGKASDDIADLALHGVYLTTVAGAQADALGAYRAAANDERAAEVVLEETQRAQRESIEQLRAARDATIAAEDQAKAQLAQEKRELAALLAQSDVATRRSSTVKANSTSGTVPTASGASAAVSAAESRQGDPYQWGAAGPDDFDCSGLTMWSWARGGVTLPHSSGSQYATTEHIPISEVEPGDLVYPSDPAQHVAMYIGNGEIIHAPHSGAVVRVEPLSSWYVLASRP